MLPHMKIKDIDTIICRCVQWETPNLVHTCLQEQLMDIT